MEPEDLHRAEAPAMPLCVEPGIGGRHDSPTEAARYVEAGPARLGTRSEASVSSLMHHSFQPPMPTRAL